MQRNKITPTKRATAETNVSSRRWKPEKRAKCSSKGEPPEISSEYERYLLSAEWKFLRDLVTIRAGSLCERCGISYIHSVHHLTYERIFHESLEDLQGVCYACHKYLHGYGDYDPMVTVELCAALEQ